MLAVRLTLVLLVAVLAALAGVLILDLPFWTFGALVGAIAVTFRIGTPLALYILRMPGLQMTGLYREPSLAREKGRRKRK